MPGIDSWGGAEGAPRPCAEKTKSALCLSGFRGRLEHKRGKKQRMARMQLVLQSQNRLQGHPSQFLRPTHQQQKEPSSKSWRAPGADHPSWLVQEAHAPTPEPAPVGRELGAEWDSDLSAVV